MSDLLGSGRPTFIGCVESPLQALNLLEYCHSTGTAIDTMVVDDCAESYGRNLPQIRRVLELADIEIAHVGDRRGTYHNPLRLRRQLDTFIALLPQSGQLVFVAGEYQSNLLWAVINRHRDRTAKVVFVDDGVGTLQMSRNPPALIARRFDRLRSKLFAAFDIDSTPDFGVTFFSAYDEVRLGTDDELHRNEYVYTRQLMDGLPTDSGSTYIVGNALAESRVVVDADSGPKLALSLVDWATERYPGSKVVYVPHRRERDVASRSLENLCEVARYHVPFELIPLETGRVPARVVGYSSSVLNNLAHIHRGAVELHAVEIPECQIKRPLRDHMSLVYDAYRNDPRIEVHGIHSQ